MEHIEHEFMAGGGRADYKQRFSIAGVTASGNLEVMMEHAELGGRCVFAIDTAAAGFAESWRAVIEDFVARNKPADLRVSINDSAASPAIVSLRLDQAFEALTGSGDA